MTRIDYPTWLIVFKACVLIKCFMPVRKRKAPGTAYVKLGKKMRTALVRANRAGSARHFPRMRRRRGFSLKTHKFTRYGPSKTIATNGGGIFEYDDTEVFTFNGISNYTEFTTLFDRYMITGVKLVIQMVTNPDATTVIAQNTPAQGSNYYPKIWYIPDYDDGTGETIAQLKERIGVKCRILRPNSAVSIFVKPAILAQTYRTALTTGYAPMWRKWIDCSDTDVPHYGLKYAIDFDGLTPSNNFTFRIERKYYFTMKDVR